MKPWREQFREQVEAARESIERAGPPTDPPFMVDWIPVTLRFAGSSTDDSLAEIVGSVGRVNRDGIEGEPPGSVLLHGHSSYRWPDRVAFYLWVNPHGWNGIIVVDSYEKARSLGADGQGSYDSADLAGLFDAIEATARLTPAQA